MNCNNCVKHKTWYCPSSIDCMIYDDKPFYQDRISLLDENEKLKESIERIENFCNYLLTNNEVEIEGEKYFKHSCDDVITKAILDKLKENVSC